MSAKRKRTSKSEWFAAALEFLEREGIAGVRVDVLAKSLGIARSGFYWHFKDRDALLQELLDYWTHEFTEVISTNPKMLEAEPHRALEETVRLVRDYELSRYDLAFVAWGRRDRKVAERVQQVFDMRLAFIRKHFSRLGFRGNELEMRSRLFLCYHMWERSTFSHDSERKLKTLLSSRMALLLGLEKGG